MPVATLVGYTLAVGITWWTQSRAAVMGAVVILAFLLVRRLDGVVEDLRSGDPARRVVIGRLVFDQRPGQQLAGARRRH
jgi:hypothetical protein